MENRAPGRITDLLPPRITDRLALAMTYYWLFYHNQNSFDPDFQPDLSDLDPTHELASIQAFFVAKRQLDSSDVDISRIILNHPIRASLLPNLRDEDITFQCGDMYQAFERGWGDDLVHSESNDVETPKDFALRKADAYLYTAIPSWRQFELWKARQTILKMVLEEKFTQTPDLKALLSPEKK